MLWGLSLNLKCFLLWHKILIGPLTSFHLIMVFYKVKFIFGERLILPEMHEKVPNSTVHKEKKNLWLMGKFDNRSVPERHVTSTNPLPRHFSPYLCQALLPCWHAPSVSHNKGGEAEVRVPSIHRCSSWDVKWLRNRASFHRLHTYCVLCSQ